MTEELETGLPRGIGRVAARALAERGLTRLDQLSGVTVAELSRMHGVGPKAIGVLRETLGARGMGFAGEDLSPGGGS